METNELNQTSVVFVGCSGYGNIGDDTYPLVIKKYFPGANIIFKNSDAPRTLPDHCMLLVMGPGGIIYQDDSAHFCYMKDYMEQAVQRKIPLIFLSCGVQSTEISLWKGYFDYAEFITVRSKGDLDIIRAITTNKKVFYYPDLAYLFNEMVDPAIPIRKYSVFVPFSSPDKESILKERYLNTAQNERVLMRMSSLSDIENNYIQWLNLGTAIPIIKNNPAVANFIISNAQKVYTSRYHALIFARSNNRPVELALNENNVRQSLKIHNEDLDQFNLLAINHIIKLGHLLHDYISYTKKRIAIIHDDFSISGGGEKLISILAENLLGYGYTVDIYTYDISENTKSIISPLINVIRIKNPDIKSDDDSVKRYLFSKLRLENQYDFFIFSGHSSMCAAEYNKPNMLYAHNIPKTEPVFETNHVYINLQIAKEKNSSLNNGKVDTHKYIDTFDESIATERIWKKLYLAKLSIMESPILPTSISNLAEAFRTILKHRLKVSMREFFSYQKTNKRNLSYIQKVITNSKNIQRKFFNKYGIESQVIFPPIETSEYYNSSDCDYWLSINRCVPLKRIELQIKAFAMMPDKKLIIIGDLENNSYFNYLMSIKPPNVILTGVVSEREKKEYLSKCTGFLFTAEDEDFGMSVVEAMAAGKPVIAPYEGGCIETVIDGLTGTLIDNIDEHKIVQAVEKISMNSIDYKIECIKQARKFDVYYFTRRMINIIENENTD